MDENPYEAPSSREFAQLPRRAGRPIGITILALGFVCFGTLGLMTALRLSEQLPFPHGTILVTQQGGACCVGIGLWWMRKWAVILYALIFASGVLFAIVMQSLGLRICVSSVVLVYFVLVVRPNWYLFTWR